MNTIRNSSPSFGNVSTQGAVALSKTVAAICLSCVCMAAAAETVTVLGDTTAGPTWNRTLAGNPPTGLSAVGTAVHYMVTPFQVSQSSTYSLLNQSTHDSYLHIYTTAFDPLGQFMNLIAADDDAGPGSDSLLNANLAVGTQYLAVSSGFANVDFGQFTLTISGQGDIILGTANNAVPEPTSLALASLALLGLVVARRRHAA